jgi:hypothetical protein
LDVTSGPPSRTEDRAYDPAAVSDRSKAVLQELDRPKRWADEACASVLAQVLEVEEPPARLGLVRRLAGFEGPAATAALARRAVFDLSPEVREAATKSLADRPPDEYRATLLDGLRHPWAPAAAHAAEALAALGKRDVVPDLVDLLDAPDPSAPFRRDDGRWVVRELVRVNHLGNCLLCHAPSADKDDPIRAPIPQRGEPLPRVYYEDFNGPAVRADVTYLRQNFSVMAEVRSPGRWPAMQRFDFLVRTRGLTEKEEAALRTTEGGPAPPASPRRDVVLAVLRELTGADPGDSAAAWRRWLQKSGNERR